MRTKPKALDVDQRSHLNEQVVQEIRVWMVRRDLNQGSLAERVGENQVWVSRRLGTSRDVMITLAEVERFARALDVSIDQLLSPATRQYADVLDLAA
jgi:transcriptional regulator with XRE-family HTH domain